LQLVSHGQEVGIELFFSGDQTEGHAGGIVADPFTRTLHAVPYLGSLALGSPVGGGA
jgi:hypothetical protein